MSLRLHRLGGKSTLLHLAGLLHELVKVDGEVTRDPLLIIVAVLGPIVTLYSGTWSAYWDTRLSTAHLLRTDEVTCKCRTIERL